VNGTDFRLFIVITAAGVPSLIVGLGWFEQMAGFVLGNYQLVSAGNAWIVVGVLIYVIKMVLLGRLHNYLKHDRSVDQSKS
jgi:hypothetical protein